MRRLVSIVLKIIIGFLGVLFTLIGLMVPDKNGHHIENMIVLFIVLALVMLLYYVLYLIKYKHYSCMRLKLNDRITFYIVFMLSCASILRLLTNNTGFLLFVFFVVMCFYRPSKKKIESLLSCDEYSVARKKREIDALSLCEPNADASMNLKTGTASDSEVLFCDNCGKRIDINDKFCKHCGNQVL